MEAVDPIDPRCGAKKKRGGWCTNVAGKGTGHVGQGRCFLHGGASPQAEVAGQVILARREMAVMGRPLNVTPHEAILECIRIAAGEVQYASERIAELDLEQAVGPVVTTKTVEFGEGSSHETAEGAPALNIWIVVRHAAMDRLVKFSKTAIDAGVAERQVELAERQGQMLVMVIRGILGDLGVADRPEAPAIVRRHLSLVASSTSLTA